MFYRFLAFAFAATAFGLSIASNHVCNFVEGKAVYYQEPRTVSAPDFQPNPIFTTNPRQKPIILDEIDFSLGIFRMQADEIFDTSLTRCVFYSDEEFSETLDVGPAEAFARFFAVLATIMGGLATIGVFIVGVSGSKSTSWSRTLGSMLVMSACFQVFTATLLGSEHCGKNYWESFLAEDSNQDPIQVSVGCSFSDGAFFSVSAIVIYILGSAIVFFRWGVNGTQLCHMEWNTINHSDRPIMVNNARTNEDLQPMIQDSRSSSSSSSRTPEEDEPEEIDAGGKNQTFPISEIKIDDTKE
jgi:hypothetical protein